MASKQYLCNQCGRWNTRGAYVLEEDGWQIWIGEECLTPTEVARYGVQDEPPYPT